MVSKRGQIEHRRHRRYAVGRGIIVSTPYRIGEVINMGLGGLCFRAVDYRELSDLFEPAVLFGKEDLLVEELTLKMIGDYTREPRAGYRQIRIIGAGFGELKAEQKPIMRDFIMAHAG